MTSDHGPVGGLEHWTTELRDALAGGDIRIAVQPLVGLRFGEVRGFEALARWEHRTLGPIAPATFVPLTERLGQVGALTATVLDQVTRELPAWRRVSPDLRVAVNVSVETLQDERFVDELERLLAAAGCEGRWLEIEITESTFMADPERTQAVVAALRAMGCRVSIDDFGSGYSSLGYLAALPVNAIKIDRQFVMSMARDHRQEAIVRATIALGHDLGFEVVAEGVEDRETWDLLGALGCDVAQGYHIARPMQPADVPGWLEAWASGLSFIRRAKIGGELVGDPDATPPPCLGRGFLVVDHEPAIVEMIRDILEEHGFRVLTAANGSEALRMVDQHTTQVVLLDMNMPVLDGEGFIDAVRDRGLSIPIVVMTAGSSAKRWARQLHADGYLSKPFEIASLVDLTTRLTTEKLD